MLSVYAQYVCVRLVCLVCLVCVCLCVCVLSVCLVYVFVFACRRALVRTFICKFNAFAWKYMRVYSRINIYWFRKEIEKPVKNHQRVPDYHLRLDHYK